MNRLTTCRARRLGATSSAQARFLLAQKLHVKTEEINNRVVGQVFAGDVPLPIYSDGKASEESLIELAHGWLSSLCQKEAV